MITADEAVAVGRGMLGTPYSTYDCINFIKAIIRQAKGGEKKYTTAGTNSLWRSRDLTERQENLANPQKGMLAFKVSGSDVHHVGLVTGPGTVLHSSSAKGCVVETDLLNGQWHYLARHRLIETGGADMENGSEAAVGRAVVATESTGLRLRSSPETGKVLTTIPKGETVEILEEGTWPRVAYKGRTGYCMGSYLTRCEAGREESGTQVEAPGTESGMTTLISLDDGRTVSLYGRWRVAED